jgi:hypothetical protein
MSSHAPPVVFESFHRGLLQVHGELREGAGQIEAAARGAVAEDVVTAPIAGFCQTLLDHHKAEDRFFFPAFRAGRLRSSDLAFLDARNAEHRDIHRLCLELREAGARQLAGWRLAVARLAGELAVLSAPHFAAEEAALTPQHLPALISADGLVSVYRDMGRNWNRR